MESIPLNSIIPSPDNPRKTFDASGLQELAESIRQVGVLQPVVLRPTDGRFFIEPATVGGSERWLVLDRMRMRPNKGYDGAPPDFASEVEAQAALPRFQLVAGERRWRAAQVAGLSEIPAVVRELTDVQAAELAIVENLLRSDVSPFEEAMGFRRLIDLGAHTADSLAEKLGKSRSHVFSRLRLCRLGEPVRKAMEEGKIEASTAELLSKFDTEALQAEALQELVDSVAQWAREEEFPIPFRRAKKLLEEFYPALSNAPWPLKLDDLPGGSCKACPKRAGNMPDAPAGIKGPNVCTDRHCFRDRLRLARQRKLETLLTDQTPTLATLAEHDEALGDHFRDGEFGYGSPWVSAEQICYDAKKEGSTWGAVLKDLPLTPTTLVGPDGRWVKAYPVKDAKTAAGAAKLLHACVLQDSKTKDRAALIEENRQKRFVEAELAGAVLAAAAATTLKDFLVRYIASAMGRSFHARKYLKAQFGDDETLHRAALAELSVPQLQGTLVAMEIASGDAWYAYATERWAESLEVDAKAITKKATAAYKAQNNQKAAKSKGAKKQG